MSLEKKIFLSFAILIVFIYGQSLFGTFVFDDRGILEHAELFSSLDRIFQVASYPYWTVDAGLYRPTTLVSYLFNSVLLGSGAFGFHLINLVLYFGICSLIYLLIKKLFQDEKLALFTALIYLVLPIHTEVVANISGRSELLALFFSLLVLAEFVREKPNFWRTGLWMLLAIGAKETAIATVPLVLIILFIQRRREWHGFAGMGVGILLYFVLRLIVLGPEHFLGVETSLIENPLLFATFPERVATALQILSMYISKTFWPVNLCSDYSYNQIPVSGNFLRIGVLLGLFSLLGAVSTFFLFLKKRPVISLASAIFLLSFFPVSNLLFPIGTIAGERLFFFPSLGFALLVAYFLSLASRRNVLIVTIIALVAVYGFLSFRRQAVWMSEEKLFLDAAQCAPSSVLSLSNLGTVYYFRSEYGKAREALEASRAIAPIYSKGLNNLGLVYWKEGKIEEAKDLYYEALSQRYPYPGVAENLFLLYMSVGDQKSAERWLRVTYPLP